MGLLSKKDTDEEKDFETEFHFPTSDKALIIFTRNPELGKVKTRLAKGVGDESALEIYKFLLQHTVSITEGLSADKQVFYSEKIRTNDLWDPEIFDKKLQFGPDLGDRMIHAFGEAFRSGYKKAIIIGSDMYDLSQKDIEQAFAALDEFDFVVGPAQDGGYYLLGMTFLKPELFQNKDWGTETVLEATLADLNAESFKLLQTRNDVDYYEDIEGNAAFFPFLPKHLKDNS
ncbi:MULTISPECIES: TIGR04282 family arsenosugar biosynthesis glycosyltransferase [unclassified Leeuwenhoekiella]|uniref:TIGR04282 family arsenosugar biosynthesis glycosyltransferase n=1 Tax=unclassified Leeuwenhoekiella TaxID=2615029 RepID=UPI000C67CA04|nr:MULTISPECIES: TIGR04282 family arsenosugar biosynthesis glycosyltransferase [unclassified Leeuwenhoekiella]MAW96426.1 glycosyltransferase [Leeuwenhoekiella sp.]MBA81313.1 glycosyltransferase [Leeuwenhoekiella sp.]|tara:strand:+ start:977 stop:1666 length:690 start_codon:yes stop_codon:yes gene_type:complete